MNSSQPTTVRDPVCGMSVNPATSQYSHDHAGTKYNFCAPACREQFIASPDKFSAKTQPVLTRKRPALGKEILVAGGIFVAVVAILVMARGIARQQASTKVDSKIIGASAGRHETIDGGQGGVIAEAKHEQNSNDLEFSVSLDTHTVDLTSFDAVQQIRLHAAGQEYAPATVVNSGERSSHHQNYQVSFPLVENSSITVVVHDVGGIEERQLPFRL